MITPSFGLTATERVLPRLALDFTTSSFDPRITFTRADNTATRINASGFVEIVNADVPRFDYSPTTLVCKGLLIEEASINLLTYSEDFSNAAWSLKTNVGVAASATTDPAGGTGAYTLTANAAAVTFGRTVTGTIGVPYSFSIWIRRKTGTGTIGLFVGDNTLQDVTSQVSSTWNRITVSNTPTSTTVRAYVRIAISGDEIEVYGAQLEQKAFGTSYIPTTTTAVTRNADVATMTGTNFSDWFNVSEGALKCVFTTGADTISVRAATISDGTTAKQIGVIGSNGSGNGPYFFVNDTTAQATIPSPAAITANTTYTVVGAYKENNFAGSVNGNVTATDASGTLPTVDRLEIGSTTATLFGNCWIVKIQYWPQRLTDNEVRAFAK